MERKRFPYRPIVYIANKFSGDVEENTRKARYYSRVAVEMGYIPLTPHLLFPQFLDEEEERDLAAFMDLVLLTKCVELWVCGEISPGMTCEIERARRRKMNIRYFNEDMEEIKG